MVLCLRNDTEYQLALRTMCLGALCAVIRPRTVGNVGATYASCLRRPALVHFASSQYNFFALLFTLPTINDVSTGDLYGGAHYIQSSSADMTPQGRAIKDAANRFGNGRTLPFSPCKKGFIPFADNERKYACPLHNKYRRRRVLAEKGRFRPGELDLNMFWSKYENGTTSQKVGAKGGDESCRNEET